jgi:beta-glucosidase-like glycosyl hydrolase
MGIHVNFAPVADVNNNPRNPVINTRSYGEDPARVAALVAAYLQGARDGGMIATIKHFPGHGDTDVDSHIGLPVVTFDRARLDRLELVPFKLGFEQGAGRRHGRAHRAPALDPTPSTPATFSAPVLRRLLRDELGFGGLVYTDSMSMDAVAKMLPPGEGAVRAVLGGADLVLHSPDPIAAFKGVKAAMAAGRISEARLDESVERVLRAKASVGLHVRRAIDLDAVPESVGGRAHQAVAQEAFTRSITLVKGRAPPGAARRSARHRRPVSVGSRLPVRLADRRAGPHVHSGTEETLAAGDGHRGVGSHAAGGACARPLHRLALRRHRRVRLRSRVVWQRPAGPGGAARPVAAGRRTRGLAGRHADGDDVLRNPYVAAAIPELPAVLLTYDFYDMAEAAAVRAIAGKRPSAASCRLRYRPRCRSGSG